MQKMVAKESARRASWTDTNLELFSQVSSIRSGMSLPDRKSNPVLIDTVSTITNICGMGQTVWKITEYV